ncbi:NAD-dependent aldehyde dehydrogenase [Candidatus Methanoperedens nitroreducens]|uniref:NAD-dependent aldehyde dehydrogenase n=1 Tax=Candidatus Methanoperedens nitratireducens TaxID=1392998 RepID=A0A062UX31_9EURY|nr:NAD-dependent succinate-semialdehyde dehydrogenase [Candidatus Methanoperedens nitroreducens]KCZ71551.1 NAD-dependent aldehyde dehydrogenase [Candidatus Methanoperedens nitroreducens]MDJ1421178.1 NAD-dependent succinate-semialdehyde dehydrogenase [Candidatus Methanoperedens sp.]
MKKIVSINPATEKINREFELYSQERINEAVRKSMTAFSGWKNLDISDRAEYLLNAAKVLRRRKAELGEIITIEMGKPIKESIPEVEKCAWALEYFAENAKRFLEPEIVETDAKKAYVSFEPRGTILCIMPWNFPFWQALRFAAPALSGGNVVLLKHSSYVPLCALELENVFLEAGFSEGIFQTLLIDGSTASSLIKRKEIDAVSLTGSVSAGQKVAEVCGQNMKKFVLELGGSDPFIVLADADIEKAAKIGVASRFLDAGQSCIAAKRFIVEESIAEEFTSKFVEHASNLKVGDPMDPDTDIGPLVREEQIELLEEQVKDALSRGAKALLEGGILKRNGFFYSPVVLTDVTQEMKVLKEETFGPLAPVIPVKDESEAIKVANESELGLGASIWSEDREKALLLSRELEVGVVVINSLVKSDPRLPFGGVKKSGIGRELSKFGLYEFMNIKSISVY